MPKRTADVRSSQARRTGFSLTIPVFRRRRAGIPGWRVGFSISGVAMNWIALFFGLASALLVVQPVSPEPTRRVSSREGFLQSVDAAFASRDWRKVAALADTTAWREAGYSDLGTLTMSLPKGHLTRFKDLSETSVLYRDSSSRSWRLTLRGDGEAGAWKAVIHANPCPRGGNRPRPGSRGRPEITPSVTIWTVLECWPLPM